MNGAEKIVNAMKKVNQSNQTIPSQIVSATITSVNPLIFQLENRLSIDSNFYELSNLVDWTNVEIGEVFRAFSFNEGQKYYILEKTPYNTANNPAIISQQVQEIKEDIEKEETLSQSINDGRGTANILLYKKNNFVQASFICYNNFANINRIFNRNGFISNNYKPDVVDSVIGNLYSSTSNTLIGIIKIGRNGNFYASFTSTISGMDIVVGNLTYKSI